MYLIVKFNFKQSNTFYKNQFLKIFIKTINFITDKQNYLY